MFRNVLLLVAALLSVTLPPPPQLTSDRLAECSAPDRHSAMAALLDGGDGNNAIDAKAKKRAPKPSTPAVTVCHRLMTLRRIVVAVEETVTQQITSASSKLAKHDDVRRVVRRFRPAAHPQSPEDLLAA